MDERKAGGKVSAAELQALEASTAEALSVIAGLLAEAVGSYKLAYHFGAALSGLEKAQPNAQRDRLLDRAFRLVLMKAIHHAPDDPVLQDLAATLRSRQQRH